jgi:hypothetical protein
MGESASLQGRVGNALRRWIKDNALHLHARKRNLREAHA